MSKKWFVLIFSLLLIIVYIIIYSHNRTIIRDSINECRYTSLCHITIPSVKEDEDIMSKELSALILSEEDDMIVYYRKIPGRSSLTVQYMIGRDLNYEIYPNTVEGGIYLNQTSNYTEKSEQEMLEQLQGSCDVFKFFLDGYEEEHNLYFSLFEDEYFIRTDKDEVVLTIYKDFHKELITSEVVSFFNEYDIFIEVEEELEE